LLALCLVHKPDHFGTRLVAQRTYIFFLPIGWVGNAVNRTAHIIHKCMKTTAFVEKINNLSI